MPELACHAGGRGFESRRSRRKFDLDGFLTRGRIQSHTNYEEVSGNSVPIPGNYGLSAHKPILVLAGACTFSACRASAR